MRFGLRRDASQTTITLPKRLAFVRCGAVCEYCVRSSRACTSRKLRSSAPVAEASTCDLLLSPFAISLTPLSIPRARWIRVGEGKLPSKAGARGKNVEYGLYASSAHALMAALVVDCPAMDAKPVKPMLREVVALGCKNGVGSSYIQFEASSSATASRRVACIALTSSAMRVSRPEVLFALH